jgi:hypothetical protein
MFHYYLSSVLSVRTLIVPFLTCFFILFINKFKSGFYNINFSKSILNNFYFQTIIILLFWILICFLKLIDGLCHTSVTPLSRTVTQHCHASVTPLSRTVTQHCHTTVTPVSRHCHTCQM